ncbi:hypothetical protein BP6252_12849 [Coleophoma cylindrospora]|uniref:Blue (type 1) copper domain-containing protein n=1 Tax=Coleophoma cylindrospora TaxID=1849047 RepID=A0A3D8QD21_9HELO|nr:hypothetical protein BP6252_12849 [Coleophoma cylindrospora]
MRFNSVALLTALAAGFFSQATFASEISNRSPAAPAAPDAGKGAGSKTSSSAAAAKTTAAAGAGTPPASKIIKIVVGSPDRNKSLVFTPNDIKAAPGDVLQFQFSMINHTVTQSTFANPCMPIAGSEPNAAEIHSGFVPVGANQTTVTTFEVPINNTQPMYLYCAQGPHCMLGMVMTVNAAANQSFAEYKAAAAKATANVPATTVKGGVLGSIPAADAVPPPQ